ncbi:hypothetical protein B9Q01_01975 [Candidatus Marsarchaeota G1 archaeon OSP_D]|jgi:hypothetical protein|uniref:Uncharacterized protein n=1 Tax=Candidatus Marsarchaeota G1 archaeon OSP_D TaxID=1978155 RepID=A0A2R6ACU5_9ARCH|nr:MAG: hypothetical protein B9Q01_01975 [Candidatus Marsarchaeota G1 archaeon OSP_D]
MRLGKVLLIFTLVVITIGVTSFLFLIIGVSRYALTRFTSLVLPLSPLLLFPYFYEKLGVIDKHAFVYWAVAIATFEFLAFPSVRFLNNGIYYKLFSAFYYYFQVFVLLVVTKILSSSQTRS